MTGDLAPPDVGSELLSREFDPRRVALASPLGLRDRGRYGAHGQHTPAGGDQSTLPVARRASVEEVDALLGCG
jgi:hypothetical protein